LSWIHTDWELRFKGIIQGRTMYTLIPPRLQTVMAQG